MEGSCERGNEPSGAIKCGEFLEELFASREGLCYMELREGLRNQEFTVNMTLL